MIIEKSQDIIFNKIINMIKIKILLIILLTLGACSAISANEDNIDIGQFTSPYRTSISNSTIDDERHLSFLQGMELTELYAYAESYEPPNNKRELEFIVSHTDNIRQGELFQINVNNVLVPQDIYINQDIVSNFKWYKIQDEKTGLYQLTGYIATNFHTALGDKTITYGSRTLNESHSIELQIQPHDYIIQKLYIDQKIVDATSNEEAYAQFAKYFHPARDLSSEYRYYSEPFVWPTIGRLTTEFGQQRFVNDSPSSSPHSGIDIAAAQGTPIYATNAGRVTLAMNLILTGNTVVIDHGQGLFSVYYHMYENFVETGDLVEGGQLIASVGTTGFSTGPHLHFMISYYRANLEPGYFLAEEPIRFNNYQQLMH